MKRRVVASALTPFGEYKIVDMDYDGRPSRLLYGTQSSPQSGVALDGEPELLFDYNQRFMEIIYTLQPSRILMLGGGVMTLPVAIRTRFPDSHIDVIEINPSLPALAEQYFKYEPSTSIRVTVDDAVSFMASCQDKYDVIIVDAFDGRQVVEALFCAAMAERYSACLHSDGVLLANIISRYNTWRPTLAKTVLNDFGTVFQHVELYPADGTAPQRSEQNFIVAASHNEQQYDYLQSTSVIE